MARYEIATIGALDARPCRCSEAMGDATAAGALVSGGWLPTIVWPSDVEAFKRKLDPDMRATDATVSQCAQLSTGEVLAWKDFYTAWRKFEAEDAGIFGTANKLEEAQGYEARLHAWQAKLAETCKLHAPGVTPATGPDTSTIKWIVAGVAIVAVAYLASPS